jgi:hypothetical protein
VRNEIVDYLKKKENEPQTVMQIAYALKTHKKFVEEALQGLMVNRKV